MLRDFMVRPWIALLLIFIFPGISLAATTHVVSPSDLQNQLVTSAQQRQQNIDKVETFLSSSAATQAMQGAHIDARQVKTAVPTLNDQELSQLASRADAAQAHFAAGNLGTRDIAIIILGIVVIILIIVVSH